jgi:nicotinate-nucleotide adenylyltransferase
VSRTVDTVHALGSKYPGAEFSLLMGADLVDELPAWKGADELLELVEIHVIGREGYKSPPTHDLRLPNISSTAIREAISSGNRNFYRPRISARVVEMIESNGWYHG